MTTADIKKLVAIAQEHIPGLENRPDLEPRNNDAEDFIDVAVWCLEDALIAAYKLGKADGKKQKEEREKSQ